MSLVLWPSGSCRIRLFEIVVVMPFVIIFAHRMGSAVESFSHCSVLLSSLGLVLYCVCLGRKTYDDYSNISNYVSPYFRACLMLVPLVRKCVFECKRSQNGTTDHDRANLYFN